MLAFPVPEKVQVNEIHLSVHRAGPKAALSRGVVVLLHGFPDLALTWRYQIPALARAGYMVIAPDLRGYGRSDRPCGQDAYKIQNLVNDVTGLLDHYEVEKATVIGHDWGAMIGWSLPFYCPERIVAVAGLNVPFMPRSALAPTALFEKIYGKSMYALRFQDKGVCEAIFEEDMARTMRFFMRSPVPAQESNGAVFDFAGLDLVGWFQGLEADWPGRPFLPAPLLRQYTDAFRKNGMTAPLHYYRNLDDNWRDMVRFQPPGETIGLTRPALSMPALMITAELDGVCTPELADGMEGCFTDYERVDIMGAGHWTQQEKPNEVNSALIDWLSRKVPRNPDRP